MNETDQPCTLRAAVVEDVPLILSLIRELAEFEKLSHEVVADEQQLRDCLFGERPFAEATLAYVGDEPVGYALYFHTFSTFLGKPGLYLEDLYIRPPFRGRGYGKVLLQHVAELALKRKCGRLEWAVLHWNEKAIRFYRSLGGESMNEWTVYRLTSDALSNLARTTQY